MKRILLITLILVSSQLVSSPSTLAASQVGRLGVGMSNHIISGLPTISMKLQRNRSSALGGLFGIDSSPDGSFYALGLKYFRLIYEEPQLNFYSALGGAMFTYNNIENDATEQAYQIDGVFGTEFSFQGIESVGFSFEFGIGMNNYQGDTHISTLGYNVVQSAVHFYL
jgi:hypothetical protein